MSHEDLDGQTSHFPGKLTSSNDNDLLLCRLPGGGEGWIHSRFVQKAIQRKKHGAVGKHAQSLCSSELWNSDAQVWVTDEAAPKITPLISGQNRGLSPFMISTACWMPSSPRILCTLGISNSIPF